MAVGPELIPIYRAELSGNERRYVLECLDTAMISSAGAFVPAFEEAFAKATNAGHAVSVTSGSTALHLALHGLGIGPGDEVIVPTFTFIASVNAIIQTGAKAVFVDSGADDWMMDVDEVAAAITNRTKAVIAVHLYSGVCDLPALVQLLAPKSIYLLEDCAEALGSSFAGKHVGNFGVVGLYSFYGNKTITTGEGGMITTGDAALAERFRQLRNHSSSRTQRYWHSEPGFNYKMTNICAAIGLAQLERLTTTVERKREIAARYRANPALASITFQRAAPSVRSAEWLLSMLLPDCIERSAVLDFMAGHSIDARPVFCCAHEMPMYAGTARFPHAERISRQGISLPSYPGLRDAEVDHVASTLAQALEVQG